MQTISKTILAASFLFLAIIPLRAQCISDECGDIFADWALLSEQVTICEGATFEVINQTTFPDIDFYVWDWGNGERDTVYEVSNYFYTYLFEEESDVAVASTSVKDPQKTTELKEVKTS